jgi:hypothetical protein
MQTQFSKFPKAQQVQQAQQTHYSTQQAQFPARLEGISNRMDRLETLYTPNNTSPHHTQQPLLPRPIPFMDAAAPNGTMLWKPADIGLFYPDMARFWDASEVVVIETKVYYRTVYAFTNRLRVAAQSRNPKEITQNLYTCFRGEALRWWNNELDKITRAGLSFAATIDDWHAELEKRFPLVPRQADTLLCQNVIESRIGLSASWTSRGRDTTAYAGSRYNDEQEFYKRQGYCDGYVRHLACHMISLGTDAG